MPVLINFKVCDNASECDGISICPAGAFQWNDEKKTIFVDNSLCINCGKCADSCSVGAIRFAKDNAEYENIKKEIEEDPRTMSDLFVDRYGAQSIQMDCLCEEHDFENLLRRSAKPMVVELFDPNSAMCLLRSIPVREILEEYDNTSVFKKVEIQGKELLKKYNIQELPALLFFKDNALIGKVEGFIENANKEFLFSSIQNIKK